MKNYTITDHQQWVEVRMDDGTDVKEADLVAFRADLHTVEDWQTKPVLIHMGALTGVSLEGRERLNRYRHPTPVAVLGTTPMDRVLAGFLLRSPTHARYVTTRTEGLHWLGITQPTTTT